MLDAEEVLAEGDHLLFASGRHRQLNVVDSQRWHDTSCRVATRGDARRALRPVPNGGSRVMDVLVLSSDLSIVVGTDC
jgi:hypothetical protein